MSGRRGPAPAISTLTLWSARTHMPTHRGADVTRDPHGRRGEHVAVQRPFHRPERQRPPANAVEGGGRGQVYMTGDSVGYITDHWVELRTFPIYKIQHHGSRNNSQISKSSAGIGKKVEMESALLSILNHYVDR